MAWRTLRYITLHYILFSLAEHSCPKHDDASSWAHLYSRSTLYQSFRVPLAIGSTLSVDEHECRVAVSTDRPSVSFHIYIISPIGYPGFTRDIRLSGVVGGISTSPILVFVCTVYLHYFVSILHWLPAVVFACWFHCLHNCSLTT